MLKTSYLAISLGLVYGGSCPFGYGSSDKQDPSAMKKAKDILDGAFEEGSDNSTKSTSKKRKLQRFIEPDDIYYPGDLFPCIRNGTEYVSRTPDTFSSSDYDKVSLSFNENFDRFIKKDTDNRSALPACLLRLSGHDFMDFRLAKDGLPELGGADGCVALEDGSNKGLIECLTDFDLPEAYDAVCDQISLADWLVVSTEAALSRVAPDYDREDMY